MRMNAVWQSILTILLALPASAWAQQVTVPTDSSPHHRVSWPGRYGPTHNGHVPAKESINLPTEWNEETGQNILWKTPLPGLGHSTPVIGDGRIWMTSATADGTQQFVLCVDETTGQLLHQKLLFENTDPEPLGNNVNTYASPSCVLEPDALYVHFGTYGTARLDPETLEVVWQRRDIRCRHFRGPGSSPVVYDNLIILTFDGIDQQFVIALDKKTGQTVWRTDRSTDYGDVDADGTIRANGDYRKSYNTPALTEVDGRMQLISTGARAAFGYDARTGEEIWTITHDDFNGCAVPLLHKGTTLINTGSGRANLICVKLDSTTRGNVDKTHVLWNRDKGNSDLSSPILVGDLVFQIATNGVGFCVHAQTGEQIWRSRVAGGTYVASPILANGLIYLFNEEGQGTVIRVGEELEIVASNSLNEGMRSSPAVANGALFLRTFHHLYKIGPKE